MTDSDKQDVKSNAAMKIDSYFHKEKEYASSTGIFQRRKNKPSLIPASDQSLYLCNSWCKFIVFWTWYILKYIVGGNIKQERHWYFKNVMSKNNSALLGWMLHSTE